MKVRLYIFFALVSGLCLMSVPVISDIVGVWLFEEGKGDVAKDSSGRGHDGVISGCEWAKGIVGTGLRFVGPPSKMEVPDHEDFHFTNKLTIALWANIEALPMDHVGIPGKGHDQPIGSFVFHPSKLNANQYELRFYVSIGNQWPVAKSDPINFGEWHHLAGTYDGKVISVYVDGKFEGKTEAKGEMNISEGTPLKFAHDCCGGRNLVGVLDEIYILNEVLNEAGIAKAKDGLLLSVEPKYKTAISWGMVKDMR